jgi:hypothetical protein
MKTPMVPIGILKHNAYDRVFHAKGDEDRSIYEDESSIHTIGNDFYEDLSCPSS